MIARVIGYVLLFLGSLGVAFVDDPDVYYPAIVLAVVGAVVIIEGAISQIVNAIKEN